MTRKKAPAKKAAGLSPKQARFVAEYLKDQNATQAAIRAGYSKKTAAQQGSRLLMNVEVARAVGQKQERVAKKAEVTVDTLARELEQARSIALKEKQSSAAVQATMGKAKLYGLGVENKRLSGSLQITTVTADDLKNLTKDELDRLEAALPVLQKLGMVDGDSDGEGEG